MTRHIGAQPGQGMLGTVSRATLKDQAQVAVQTARRKSFLNPGRAEYEVAKDGLHASRFANAHLCQLLGWTWSFGNAYTVWQLLPATSRASHDLFLEHYHLRSAGYLHDSLSFLARVVLYLNHKSFPLFDCHTSDLYIVPETGWLVITDYASSFSPDSGNIALLRAEFHGPPDARAAFLAMTGISQAAKIGNEHVFACYLLLNALACEQRILPDAMAEAAFCRFQPAMRADTGQNLIWRLSIKGLLSHDLPVEKMVDPALLLQAL